MRACTLTAHACAFFSPWRACTWSAQVGTRFDHVAKIRPDFSKWSESLAAPVISRMTARPAGMEPPTVWMHSLSPPPWAFPAGWAQTDWFVLAPRATAKAWFRFASDVTCEWLTRRAFALPTASVRSSHCFVCTVCATGDLRVAHQKGRTARPALRAGRRLSERDGPRRMARAARRECPTGGANRARISHGISWCTHASHTGGVCALCVSCR